MFLEIVKIKVQHAILVILPKKNTLNNNINRAKNRYFVQNIILFIIKFKFNKFITVIYAITK